MSVIIPSDITDAQLRVYQHLLGNNQHGIMFLFDTNFSETLETPTRNAALEFQTTEGEALEELRRLLAIKVFTADENAEKISPTPLMDTLWHAAILETRFYSELQAALGVVLHHRPSAASDEESESRQQRLAALNGLYSAFFLSSPIGNDFSTAMDPQLGRPARPRHGNMSITIVLYNGKRLSVRAGLHWYVEDVKSVIQDSDGTPIDHQRLLFQGKQLEDGRTLEAYRIGESATINMVLRLSGC